MCIPILPVLPMAKPRNYDWRLMSMWYQCTRNAGFVRRSTHKHGEGASPLRPQHPHVLASHDQNTPALPARSRSSRFESSSLVLSARTQWTPHPGCACRVAARARILPARDSHAPGYSAGQQRSPPNAPAGDRAHPADALPAKPPHPRNPAGVRAECAGLVTPPPRHETTASCPRCESLPLESVSVPPRAHHA